MRVGEILDFTKEKPFSSWYKLLDEKRTKAGNERILADDEAREGRGRGEEVGGREGGRGEEVGGMEGGGGSVRGREGGRDGWVDGREGGREGGRVGGWVGGREGVGQVWGEGREI